jgi:hypothetical protein
METTMRAKTWVPEKFNTTGHRATAQRWVSQAEAKYGEPFVLLATHRYAGGAGYTIQPRGRWNWTSRLSPCHAMRVFGWVLCPAEKITPEVSARLLEKWQAAFSRI